MVRLDRTFSDYIFTGDRSAGFYMHLFGVVQAHQTSSNLLVTRVLGDSTVPNLFYLHRYRDSKVCRVLMHLFVVVQAHRTSSNLPEHIITEIAHRTSSNLLEPHHYKDSKVCRVFHMSSGWFDCTEPSLSTSLQEKQGMQGAYCSGRFDEVRCA